LLLLRRPDGWARCSALYKQRLLLDQLRAAPQHFDIYVHTRFDASFVAPLHLRGLDRPRSPALYVARGQWDVMSDLEQQQRTSTSSSVLSNNSLHHAVPDWLFVGPRTLVAAALGRYEHYALLARTSKERWAHVGNAEVFLQRVLAMHGIRAEGHRCTDANRRNRKSGASGECGSAPQTAPVRLIEGTAVRLLAAVHQAILCDERSSLSCD
jgi:hypothetical protein